MTYIHHREQPKSMICRKLIRRFFEVEREDINDFEQNWILGCIKSCTNN